MDFDAATVHQYHYTISPEIPEDSRQLRQDIMKQAYSAISSRVGDFYYSGYAMYALQEVKEEFSEKASMHDVAYTVTVTFDHSFSLKDITEG